LITKAINTITERTGGMAQAVQCLLCKCGALSSNSSPAKNTKNKTKEKILKKYAKINQKFVSNFF
jgi:hypothetical protein